MSKAVIISGGTLDEGFAEKILKENEGACIIGVDRGVNYLYRHQIMPQYIVGDFDSIDADIIEYYRNETNVPIREYNPIKDASDTEIAIRLSITLGSREIYILGATGGRIDHLWANIQTLAVACKTGVKAYILDERNKVWVTDRPCELKKSEAYGPYLSIFPLDGEVYDFNLTGTKWPLRHHILKPCDSLTVSNQFEDEKVKIDFPEGLLVIMQTRDE
ncbi:thiamine diphosphokinase [Bariatricus massiliensis]|uniref:Thiamine diphosphokinase n=1 Tax=Bariatricus massiliensis TaxID=1745713 RepID=A0ABS8DE42_9FIRM|nr:thiamine diphosphokinase [Bariatricus massiliensis]MCB7302790.1 thiamine diphosphokinase [Bariatricus massiliensis]MCB7374006.1 thiamine diphosphokinase [Bariatricus massiliensis]MCB7386676.1 thiamine diphosphokinase [Bariatricus massiliensis]MCB7410838.1 thiamine diphosphokinase [Bariatricus massiliensis]MCQ5251662.1 thiamine diphosphokinase [Bariatricus massiliensis]